MTTFLLQELFPIILNMSFTASIVIVIILLARLLLRRAPKVFSYALWAVVLFRLLCPVALSGSISLLGMMDAPVQQTGNITTAVTYVQPSTVSAPGQDAMQAAPATPDTSAAAGSTSAGKGDPAPQQTAARDAIPLVHILTCIWLAGVTALAAYSIFSLLRLRRRLTDAVLLRDNIYICNAIASPFVLGILRPKIYLPTFLYDHERDYIIRHEEYHISHLDHIVKILAFAALCIHWFNPLVWLAFFLSNKDMEMRCDEAVVKKLGGEIRADYSASLLALATGRHIIAATPLAFGEGDTRGRIRNVLRWRRPKPYIAVLSALVCLLVLAACAFNPAKTATGQYESMDDYAQQAMDSAKEVTYYKVSGGSATEEQATASVTGTRLAELEKKGELPGLAPEGTLEAWTFRYLVQIDTPAEEVALVGGMYEENGWFDLEGQGGRNIVALRYENGSYDILYDQPVNDNMAFYGYHQSYAEAIYDWYVTENGLDLPLYVADWTDRLTPPDNADLGTFPAHRYDGDGWYLYIPVMTWTQQSAAEETWIWTSDYLTGSSLTVEYCAASPAEQQSAQQAQDYTPANDEQTVWSLQRDGINSYCYLFPAADGGTWRVSIQCADNQGTDSPYIALEPRMLQLMAESFTVDDGITAGAITGVLGGIENGTPLQISLVQEKDLGPYDNCWDTGNGVYYAENLKFLTWQQIDGSSVPNDLEQSASVTLSAADGSWSMTAYKDSSIVRFTKDGQILWLLPNGNDFIAYHILRGWFDEAEYDALGGGYDNPDAVIIPDKGQDYLSAAQEFCTATEEFHLKATPGSSFCYTFVQAHVSEAGEVTAAMRQRGEIGENTYCFYLTTVFVPENEEALAYSIAGNTGEYTGSDPAVPDGAMEYYRCGMISLEVDGWHGTIVGTGW